MNTKKKSLGNFRKPVTVDLGLAVGSIIPAIVQFPPTSPEAAQTTVKALSVVLDSHKAHGAPPEVTAFIEAVIIAIEHYAGH